MSVNSGASSIRLGIIGTGRIAARFIPEAECVEGLLVTAVYNPRFASAERFAQKHQLPFAANTEEELYERVDAVYIASPHETHCGYIMSALRNGKHVWCEKPMVLKKEQAVEAFNLAREQNCVLLEGIKTAYCPGFLELVDIAKSGKIGEIRDVEGSFTKLMEDTECRELNDVKNGGSFTELGSYPLLAIMKLLGTEYQDLRFESFQNDRGVDIYTKAYFRYKHGIATAKTGLGVKSEGQLLISGTEGYIRVDAPWWKTTEFEVCYEDTARNERYSAEYIGDGLRYGLRVFVAAVNGSMKGMHFLPREESSAVIDVLECFLKERTHGDRK